MKNAADSFMCKSETKTYKHICIKMVILNLFTIWILKKRLVRFVLQKQRIFDYGYLEENHKIVFYPT